MQYATPTGGKGVVELTKGSLEAIEDYILWCENVAQRKLPAAMDILARFGVMLAGAYAQKYSAGVHKHPGDTARSWIMPVPRITNRYFLGWRVARVRQGTWMLTNDSREAYYIEYGIHRNPHTGQVAPRRIRRPIFKLSFLRMMEAFQETAVAHRIWSDILVPKPGQPGRRTKQLTWSTLAFSQSPGVMGSQGIITGTVPGGGLLYKYGSR